jgi:hypothetical protein
MAIMTGARHRAERSDGATRVARLHHLLPEG